MRRIENETGRRTLSMSIVGCAIAIAPTAAFANTHDSGAVPDNEILVRLFVDGSVDQISQWICGNITFPDTDKDKAGTEAQSSGVPHLDLFRLKTSDTEAQSSGAPHLDLFRLKTSDTEAQSGGAPHLDLFRLKTSDTEAQQGDLPYIGVLRIVPSNNEAQQGDLPHIGVRYIMTNDNEAQQGDLPYIGVVRIRVTEAALVRPPSPCASDLTGDGLVDVSDLLKMFQSWGDCSGCPADLDDDATVGVNDMLVLLADWGICDGIE